MTCYEDLKWRGLIQDISDEALIDKLNSGKLTFYIGTDPTADSLHIGHYSSFLISKRLAKYGHKPILLVGGATGLIGDPKPTAERPMISYEQVENNIKGLTKQAKEIFGFEVVNNYDWTKDINVIDFLRDYGKYFNVGYMLAKDKVRSRMEVGITYAEFSYMILQALDFMHLYENYDCTLQVAGSDQWGNITAGIELIRKKLGKEVYGMVMPLVTDSNGVKFGKTEGNALWLDKEKTSSYDLYQYLINLEDSMIISYLKTLTFLSKEEIEEIEKQHNEKPELRVAQKTLAYEIIKDIHGEEEAKKAKEKSEALFGKMDTNALEEESIEASVGSTILDVLTISNLASSKSEARRLVEQGGVKVDEEKITDPNYTIDKEVVVIQKGKKAFKKVKLTK